MPIVIQAPLSLGNVKQIARNLPNPKITIRGIERHRDYTIEHHCSNYSNLSCFYIKAFQGWILLSLQLNSCQFKL